MSKTPVIPADPMDGANTPINRKHPEYQRAFAENEGLVKPNKRAADDVERPQGEKLGAAAEAAQRGRTA